MTNDINNTDQPKKPGKGNVIAGIILLMIGVSFLLNQFDFGLPHWLFGWYTWIIAVGLYMGTRSNFRSLGWLVVTAIGFAFMLNDALPHVAIARFYWPAALIGFGIYMILRRKSPIEDWDKKEWERKWDAGKFNYRAPGVNDPIVDYTVKPDDQEANATPPPVNPNPGARYNTDDYMDAVSIFGGVKKIVFSKNFQGGEVVNVFGGAELDLTQADINGRIYIDVTQIFGSTKVIVPSHWMVISDMSAVFGGVDDKRIRTTAPLDANKVLVLTGISVFAGIDIRSY